MGSNNQSTTEFEKLKEALFGISGFKPVLVQHCARFVP